MKLEKLLDSSPNSHSGSGPLRGTHGRAHIIVRLGRLGRTLLVAVGRGGARGQIGVELGGRGGVVASPNLTPSSTSNSVMHLLSHINYYLYCVDLLLHISYYLYYSLYCTPRYILFFFNNISNIIMSKLLLSFMIYQS